MHHSAPADLCPGDVLIPGWRSNYGSGRHARHIYLTATREGVPLAAEVARGEGPGRYSESRHERDRPVDNVMNSPVHDAVVQEIKTSQQPEGSDQ